VVLADVEDGAHDGVPEVRDAPTACARDLGHEPAQVQAFDEARDLTTCLSYILTQFVFIRKRAR
jgi:hypothetical protein